MLKKSLILLVLLALAVPALAETNPGLPTRAYLFDDAAGSGTAAPLAGTGGVTGTVTTLRQGTLAGAFGGAGNYAADGLATGAGRIDLAESYTGPSTGFTWSIWVYCNSGAVNSNEALLSSSGGSGQTKLLIKRNRFNDGLEWLRGKFQHYVNLDTSTDMGASGNGMYNNPSAYTGWHQMVFMYNPNTGWGGTQDWYVYSDGILQTNDQWWNYNLAGTVVYPSITLGADNYAGNAGWVGGLDEFAFYNRALTADEILWLYNHSLSELLAAPIAEPASLGLLGIGVLALRRRRS